MNMVSPITLHTDRLVLRPLDVDDAAALFAMHADPEFMRYWSATPWTSIDQARVMIERDRVEIAAGLHLRLGVHRRNAPGLIGTVSLFQFNQACRRAEVGYGIARPFWRQGYMAEAVAALVMHAFATLGLNRLEADVDPRNLGSVRGLEKLGFVREGYLRERWIVGGEVSDTALYGLLAREWSDPAAAVPPGARA